MVELFLRNLRPAARRRGRALAVPAAVWKVRAAPFVAAALGTGYLLMRFGSVTREPADAADNRAFRALLEAVP